MSAPDYPHLIQQWRDGTISPEDFAVLEAGLLRDAELRREFRRTANLEVGLRDWSARDPMMAAWEVPEPQQRVLPGKRRSWLWAAAAAAGVLIAYGATSALLLSKARPPAPIVEGERTEQGCAVLAQMVSAQFASGDSARTAGDMLTPGRFKLSAGFAQIEFFSGATVIVEGGTELELVSAWEARCLTGKARVRVPPAARGFRLNVPGVNLVDLGTEFAVNVDGSNQQADVHVFEGEVVAHPPSGPELSLRQGQSLHGAELAALDPRTFLGVGQLQELITAKQSERQEAWWQWSQRVRHDERLIAYYPFRHFPEWERLVNNAAEPRAKALNGGAVGATWTTGRWPQKDALEFKRPGDRVRLDLPGTYDALTFACWARVDALDRRYNALLLTDGYEPGEPHWQIYEDGRLMFSVMYPNPTQPHGRANQIYFSPPLFRDGNLGRWHHLAVTYEAQSGAAVQYFDGKEVSREINPFHQPARPLVFGPCEIGNWGLPTERHQFPVRNFNGRLDEFLIYRAALSSQEIAEIYQAGKPD